MVLHREVFTYRSYFLLVFLVWIGANVRNSFREWRMLQTVNALADIGFDTTKNEPSKN